MSFTTDQEAFWAGDFGRDYIDRNQGEKLLAANVAFFTSALRCARNLSSSIEFGANIGMNLRALGILFPKLDLYGLEINAQAAAELRKILPPDRVYEESIFDFAPMQSWDLVFVKGVLIHLRPDMLPRVYDTLAASSARYVLIAEYYNPSPVAIPYRGHAERLFKRDFAGEMLDRHPQFKLLDYGFVYHRDSHFPQDDINWFLLEK